MKFIKKILFYLIISAVALVLFSCSRSLTERVNDASLEKAKNFTLQQLKKSLDEIPVGKYPIRTEGESMWELTEPSAWTSGFYPGCLWNAFELSKDSTWIPLAKKYTEGLEAQQFNTEHHDVGFMMLSSYGNGYKVLEDSTYKKIILQSANSLATRYYPKVGCIQSWNGDYQVIIDNMMNLEILFWAAKNGGGDKLYDIAVNHANTTMKNHLREDGSAFHVVVYDTTTGLVKEKRTAQGYSASSAWARGEAWGIYGFTMCFRETGDSNYLNTAIKMADYFVSHLPDDYVPFWDLNLPKDDPRQYKDASAAAIACSALLELRSHMKDSTRYDVFINGMMNSLIEDYLSGETNSSGILLHCAYNANNENPYDRDASTIWGDYYFMEALLRYKNLLSNIN